MFINTLQVTKEAHFDVNSQDWIDGASTANIYRPVTTAPVLLNVSFITAIVPTTYKSGMLGTTPRRSALDRYLCDCEGSKVFLSTGASFTVTAKITELEASIGTQYPVDVV